MSAARRAWERGRGYLLDAYLTALRCAAPPALAALPLPALLEAVTSPRLPVPRDRARDAIARSERWARRLRRKDTCLYRALARWVGLLNGGAPAELVFGLRAGGEEGHAWVEIDGVPVGEARDPTLVVTARFAAAPGTRAVTWAPGG